MKTGLGRAISIIVLFSMAWGTVAVGASKDPFPHRKKYKDVPVIELDILKATKDSYLIIDARSKYEFETLHIKGAVNIPLTSSSFGKDVSTVQKAQGKKIVFYCNGGTCKKSYKAVLKARKHGIKDAIAYDAGIYEWARKVPEESVLLGKSPMRANEFIDNKVFKARLINAKDFESKKAAGAQILDIRDRIQRDTQVFPFEEERAELKDMTKIKQIVATAKKQGKTLLVYDKVGKQVRWFQYFLERHGVKNYYFMKGGSEGYYEEKLGKYRFDKKSS